MRMPEKDCDGGISRRQLLIGGSASTAIVTLSALFGKEILETILPNQISIEITKLSSIPPPRFTMRPHGPIQIQPKGLQLPQEHFLRIAQEFSQRISQGIDTELLRDFKHYPVKAHPVIADIFFTKEILALMAMHPLIRKHIKSLRKRFIQDRATFLTYINRFLIATGKYLSEDYDGKTPFMRVWDIHKIEEMEVISRGVSVTAPVLFLKTFPPSFNDDFYPIETMSVGGFDFGPNIIWIKDEYIVEREEERIKSLMQTYAGRKITGKENHRGDMGDTTLHSVLHHEGTHAILPILFPKTAETTRGFFDKNLARPVTTRINTAEIPWKTFPSEDTNQLNEFCAIGSHFAIMPHDGPYQLFYLLKNPRCQRYPYLLAYIFLLSEIVNLPGLPAYLLQKISNVIKYGGVLDSLDQEAIACHESLSTSWVNKVGEKMWSLGYRIFHDIETALD